MHSGPQNLKVYLKRYSEKLRAPEGFIVSAFCKAVGSVNIVIARTDVQYVVRTKALHLKITGPKKTEILLNREKILLALREELGVKDAPTALL